ncbi:N-myc-interactor [Trichomycterus rosablanca]|uniref:N-myc-interactor n=1 Tax=Trichomycterus rosablanca TaxID=2290929 RepID=UPI002F356E56
MSDLKGQTNGELETDTLAEQELTDAKNELEKLRKLMEAADTEKSRLFLEKMETDGMKKKAQQETADLLQAEEQIVVGHGKQMQDLQKEIISLKKANEDLVKKLQRYKEELKSKQDETDTLQQRFKINAQIPEKKMKFTHVEKEEESSEDNNEDISAVFAIRQRPSILLKGGQALITFEEEKVTDQILKLSKCTVTCDTNRVEVKPCPLALQPSVKFEVHIKVSKRTIKFSNAPPILPVERMRDRLELSFSKPSRGGGEVEKLEYDPKTETGYITFVNTGVAENLTLKGKFYVDVGKEIVVSVEPLFEYQLKKFQSFSGVPKRTLLLKDIPEVSDEEDMQDHLEIHFQKPSNYGGEVESIKYLSKRDLRAFFCEDCAQMEAQ